MNNAPKTRSFSWSTWWHRAVALALPFMTLAAIPLAEPAGAAPPQIVSESPSALATSVQTSAGTWATVPMGHLDQPLNTFWQLFYRASGRSSWSNATSTLALATNGGLIIATPDGQSVEVGIRPANRLTFSTLLTASPTQSSWTTGLLPAGLAADNSALATDSLSGSSAALLNDGAGVRAVSSARGLSTWRTLTTEAVLASSSAGRHCGLDSITAVGYDGTQALIGGGCGHAGTVGIFSRSGDRWRLVGPTLPRQLDLGSVNVISLKQTSEGISTILAVTSVKEGTSLVAAWAGSGSQWSVSGALRLQLVTACAVHRTGQRRWDVRLALRTWGVGGGGRRRGSGCLLAIAANVAQGNEHPGLRPGECRRRPGRQRHGVRRLAPLAGFKPLGEGSGDQCAN